jgi:hypothetical protein
MRIFEPERKVTGGWRRLHNEELRNLYTSPSIIRMIKSRRMIWAMDVARMGEMKNTYRILVGKPKRKRPLGRLGVGGSIILEWILGKQDVKVWTRFNWLRLGTSGGLL